MTNNEALKRLKEHRILFEGDFGWDTTTLEALDVAIRILSADVKPVERGEWIWEENEWQYRCSACRITFDYDKTYELFDHGYQYANFCPNCGTPMTEEAMKILARRNGERKVDE